MFDIKVQPLLSFIPSLQYYQTFVQVPTFLYETLYLREAGLDSSPGLRYWLVQASLGAHRALLVICKVKEYGKILDSETGVMLFMGVVLQLLGWGGGEREREDFLYFSGFCCVQI